MAQSRQRCSAFDIVACWTGRSGRQRLESVEGLGHLRDQNEPIVESM